ncbi:MAG: hypothetical protein ACREQY_02650, partial [Candidatus Binatia bacterium]
MPLGCEAREALSPKEAEVREALAPWADESIAFSVAPARSERSQAPDSAATRHLQSLVRRLHETAAADDASQARRWLGIALTLTPPHEDGVDLLEAEWRRAPDKPELRGDLAAALALRGLRRENADDLLRALDLLERKDSPPALECARRHVRAAIGLPTSEPAGVGPCRQQPTEGTNWTVSLEDLPTEAEVTAARALAGRPDDLRRFVSAAPEIWWRHLLERELLRLVAAAPGTARETEFDSTFGLALGAALSQISSDQDAERIVRGVTSSTDTRLPRALRDFSQGLRDLRAYRVESSLASLRRAEPVLRETVPVLADWADSSIATNLFYLRHSDAVSILASQVAASRSEKRFLLRARALSLLGTIDLEHGLPERTAARIAEVVECYEKSGMRRTEAAARSLLAGAESHLGDLAGAETEWVRSLRLFGGAGAGSRLGPVLNAFARSQAQAGRAHGAVAIQRAALEVDSLLGEPLGVAESNLFLAGALFLSGAEDEATSALREARRAALQIESDVQRAKTDALIDLTGAASLCRAEPRQGASEIARAVQRWRRERFRYLLPEALAVQAQCAMRLEQTEDAESALREALALRREDGRTIGASKTLTLWNDQSRSALDQLLELLLDQDRIADAANWLAAARAPSTIAAARVVKPIELASDACLLFAVSLPTAIDSTLFCG